MTREAPTSCPAQPIWIGSANPDHALLSIKLERPTAAVRAPRPINAQEQWLADNRPAIDAYNEQVDAHGTFAGALRKF